MPYSLKPIAIVIALVTLAGCVEDTGSSGGQMAPAPSGPPFIETMDSSVSGAAIASCRNALDARTDGVVRVVGSEFSQAATAVYMRVGSNGAPWRCLVSSDGRNPTLMFMGSEGYL